MIFKNLFRRSGRTLLTGLGIAVGVATIAALGAIADGLESGYGSVLTSTEADLVLSDPDSMDISMSAIDESIGAELAAMPEVKEVSGLLQGIVLTDNTPYFFIFAYPTDSFVVGRYQVTEGVSVFSKQALDQQGKPVMLGSAAAEALHKSVGDTVRLGESSFRVVGIYETGDAFEEGGAVLSLEEGQALLGKQRQVSLFYIKLEDPALRERLEQRVARVYPDLMLSTTDSLSGNTQMSQALRGTAWAISMLAILIGGVGMMNAQLMSVIERTREIGVLRAVGWPSRRVLGLILGEAMAVSIAGGLIGLPLALLMLYATQDIMSAFGARPSLGAGQIGQALLVVLFLGLVGGLYPAWRASQLPPVEALRYEGGTLGKRAARLPVGGMAIQNLWRRRTRSLLTLVVISLTIGAVMSMGLIFVGSIQMMNDWVGGSEITVRQRDAADLGYAFIDQRIGDRIAALPDVAGVSGILIGVAFSEDGFFMLQGYNPREPALAAFNVVEGRAITSNREVMVGRAIAEAQNINVGENIAVGEMRFRVVGIYESGAAWQELGGVVTLRDAQSFTGRPGKVTLFVVDLHDPNDAPAVMAGINSNFPEVAAGLSGEFASDLPDMQNFAVMTNAVSVMALIVGGIGMMNTMLMSVLERTREIGVLRALGWQRRAILGLILRESLWLSLFGAVLGGGVALVLMYGFTLIPDYGDAFRMGWSWEPVLQSVIVSSLLGLLGGLYPAFRATRLQPVEALRYE